MKTKLFSAFMVLIAALAVGAQTGTAAQTDVPLKRVKGPNNSFNDPEFGVSLTYPAGWELEHGFRWGDNKEQTTFVLRRSRPPAGGVSLFYQKFTPDHSRPADIKVWFRSSFQEKEASRQKDVRSYQNVPGSLSFRTTSTGLPMCSYMATFMRGAKTMAEYYVRVAGHETYVMFIIQAPTDEIDAICADVDQMADTVRVP